MALAERTVSPFLRPDVPSAGLGFGTEVSLKTLECCVLPAVKLLLFLNFAVDSVQLSAFPSPGVAETDRPTLRERARFRLLSIS